MSLTKNLEHLPPLKHTKVHPPSSTQTNMEPMDGQTICTVHIVQEQEQQQLNCPQQIFELQQRLNTGNTVGM